jgi:hypothetical protein
MVHRPGRNQYIGNENISLLEFITDNIHSRHQAFFQNIFRSRAVSKGFFNGNNNILGFSFL